MNAAWARAPPTTLTRLLAFTPPPAMASLLDADPSVREAFAVDCALTFVRFMRSEPMRLGSLLLLHSASALPSTATLAMLQYLKTRRVTPLQLMQDDGRPLIRLIVEAARGAKTVRVFRIGTLIPWCDWLEQIFASRVAPSDCCCTRVPLSTADNTEGVEVCFVHGRCPLVLDKAPPKKGKDSFSYAAALAGHVDCLQALALTGHDLHQHDFRALHAAASQGHVDCLEFLLDTVTSKDGARVASCTSLATAAALGGVPCLEALHRAGCLVFTSAAAHAAAANNRAEVLEYLVRNGADPTVACFGGDSAVAASAFGGHVECLQVLHRAGVDLSVQYGGTRTTPAYMAALGGQLAALKFLHSVGTPVIAAANEAYAWPEPASGAASSRLDCLEYLCSVAHETLSTSAQRFRFGRDVAIRACELDKVDSLRVLLRWGFVTAACVSRSPSNADCCALHRAAAASAACLALLANVGIVDLTFVDDEGNTLAHFAVQKTCEAALSVLIEQGVDVARQNKLGETALLIAARFGFLRCISVLAPCGALEAVDNDGRTALHAAAAMGQVMAVRLLRDNGASLTLSASPSDYAVAASTLKWV